MSCELTNIETKVSSETVKSTSMLRLTLLTPPDWSKSVNARTMVMMYSKKETKVFFAGEVLIMQKGSDLVRELINQVVEVDHEACTLKVLVLSAHCDIIRAFGNHSPRHGIIPMMYLDLKTIIEEGNFSSDECLNLYFNAYIVLSKMLAYPTETVPFTALRLMYRKRFQYGICGHLIAAVSTDLEPVIDLAIKIMRADISRGGLVRSHPAYVWDDSASLPPTHSSLEYIHSVLWLASANPTSGSRYFFRKIGVKKFTPKELLNCTIMEKKVRSVDAPQSAETRLQLLQLWSVTEPDSYHPDLADDWEDECAPPSTPVKANHDSKEEETKAMVASDSIPEVSHPVEVTPPSIKVPEVATAAPPAHVNDIMLKHDSISSPSANAEEQLPSTEIKLTNSITSTLASFKDAQPPTPKPKFRVVSDGKSNAAEPKTPLVPDAQPSPLKKKTFKPDHNDNNSETKEETREKRSQSKPRGKMQSNGPDDRSKEETPDRKRSQSRPRGKTDENSEATSSEKKPKPRFFKRHHN